MKKAIIILAIILTAFINTVSAQTNEERADFDIKLSEAYDNCLKEVNIEHEVKKYLDEEPVYINLKECIEIALLYNFYLKSADYDYLRSKWEYKNALTNFLPNIGSSSYAINYSGQILIGAALLASFEELALSINVHATHDLTRGGEQIFEALAKKNLQFALKHNYNYTRSEVLLNSAKYYYELLRTKLDIEIYQKNYRERCAQLAQTENLLSAGLGTRFDVIRSKTELAQARQNLLDSMQEFRLAQAKLANILGVEISTHLMPIEMEAREYMLVEENKSADDLFKMAEDYREDIKKIRSQIKALKDEKKRIYTQFMPKPRVSATQQWQGTARLGMGPATVLAGYLDINLGTNMGFGTITQAKAKQAEIDKTIVELEQSLRNIKEQIIKSYCESKISKDRIAISKEQVGYATESVELAELRLNAGEGILIDVIQAQTFKTRTRIELVNSIIRYNVAQIQMLFESGNITAAKLLEGYSP